MQKVNKILEIGYLVIAIVFFINSVTTYSTNKSKALVFGAFAIMATFMYFFKRKFRKKWFENNKPNN